jgi:hypothetical protein
VAQGTRTGANRHTLQERAAIRVDDGKTVCTVLDFVGQHRKEFRFDLRFRALLGGSRKDLVGQIEGGIPFLPAGCHLELDAVAKERVLARRSVRRFRCGGGLSRPRPA